MIALTPPRADLRGGNQSDDSFATSRAIFTRFAILCLFAGRRRTIKELCARMVLNPLTSARIRVTLRGSRIRQKPHSRHGFVSEGAGWGRSGCRPQILSAQPRGQMSPRLSLVAGAKSCRNQFIPLCMRTCSDEAKKALPQGAKGVKHVIRNARRRQGVGY